MERIICVKPKQYAMQCNAISSEIKLVSEPVKVFDFVFSRRPESQGKTHLQIKAVDNGTIHAVISWWVLQLDNSGSITYSTAPDWINEVNGDMVANSQSGSKDWCDHWKQCVWFVPGRGVTVSKDSFVSFKAVHDETSISYHLENGNQAIKNRYSYSAIEYSQETQLMLSPERIGLYGNSSWRSNFLDAIKNALEAKSSSFCLIVDDSVFLAVAMSHMSNTSSVVSAFPGLQERAYHYLETLAAAKQFPRGKIEVLGKRASSLTCSDLHQRKVDMLIAEPIYFGNEGALPWQNLRFWKEKTLLGSLLSEGACVIPCKGVLKACAMFLPDLWRSRHQLSSIEDFNHSDANAILGACGDLCADDAPCLPYFVWQCGKIKNLTKAVPIMEFDFSQPIQCCSGKAKVIVSNQGTCHGFVLWIDWILDEKNSIIVTTGPDCRYWKQGVKLLNKPVAVNTPTERGKDECFAGEIEASFDPSTGDIDVKARWFS